MATMPRKSGERRDRVVAREQRLATKALYRLLAQFANFDMAQARPADWAHIRLSLDDLASIGSDVARMPHIISVERVDPTLRLREAEAEVREILPALQQVIRSAAARGGPLVPVQGHMGAIPGRLLVTGSTRDVVLIMALHLLTRPLDSPLGLCPVDDRVFVKTRGQRFCRHRCMVRMAKEKAEARQTSDVAPAPPRPRGRPRGARTPEVAISVVSETAS